VKTAKIKLETIYSSVSFWDKATKKTFLLVTLVAPLFFAQPALTHPQCLELFKPSFTEVIENILQQKSENRDEAQLSQLKEIQASISKALKFEIKLRFEPQDEFINVFALNSRGVKVIEATLSYLPSKKLLIVEYIGTAPYSKLGLGQKLIEAALVRFPEVALLRADSLVADNEDVLNDYLSQGDSLETAIRKTPMFKIFSRVGFTELIPGSTNAQYGFTVYRTNHFKK